MSSRAKGGLALAALLALATLAYLAVAMTGSPDVSVTTMSGETSLADGGVMPLDAGLFAIAIDEVSASEAPALDIPPAALFPADTDTIVLLAGSAPPETVQILAEHRSGRDLYVLAAIDHSGDGEGDDEAAEDEAEDEAEDDEVDPCEELDGQDDAYCECIVNAADNIDRGYRAALGAAVTRIELFRIHEDRAGRTVLGRTVQAHRTLTGPVRYETVADDPPELRVNDVDHDGRPEVTAIFSFAAPDCDTFQEDWGTLGVLLDGNDLHVQAVFAREHVSSGGDSDVNTISDATTWRFAPSEADPSLVDLEVRRTERSSFMEAEDEGPTTDHSTTRWVCPYDAAADSWSCPNDATVLTAWVSTVSPLLGSPLLGSP